MSNTSTIKLEWENYLVSRVEMIYAINKFVTTYNILDLFQNNISLSHNIMA